MKTGIELIAEERQRQIEKEGWTKEHDANYDNNELPKAAIVYAMPPYMRNDYHALVHIWPFDSSWLKSEYENNGQARIRDLEKAGALIAAEIDRIQSQ